MQYRFIWLALMIVFSQARAGDTRPVVLDHFWTAVDQETFTALKNSSDIAALSGTEFRHTVSGERSWTGFYVYGQHTYIEFYGSAEMPEDVQLGDVGLGLTVERSGDLRRVTRLLRQRYGDAVKEEPQSRRVGDRDIPWGRTAYVKVEGHEALGWWVNETDRDYLKTMYPERVFKQPLSRHDYMLPLAKPHQSFGDVVKIQLNADAQDVARLIESLTLLGWNAMARTGSLCSVRAPDGMTIDVSSDKGPRGVRAVTMRFLPAARPRTVSVGRARLDLKGDLGILRFAE